MQSDEETGGIVKNSSHSAVLAFLGRTLSFLGRMCNKVMHSNSVYVNVIVGMPFRGKRG